VSEAIVMPELGQTSSEATIVEWLMKEGDDVELGQPLLIVETDKGQLDVECVADGVLIKVVVPAGERVDAGTIIAYIGEADEEPPAPV
jgi:pyruvate/2-oxoglutarate dehydrogenase complex dihydrolipoamide acyltransferase (E2) component